MSAVIRALERARQDVRYGLRLLARSPWFTLVSVASIALGFGGGIALFTVMNAVLFRPLPGRDTPDLHTIHTANHDGGLYGSSSYADFDSFTRSASELFAAACASARPRGNLAVGGRVHALSGAVANGGCLEAFGIRPHVGRLLNRSDDAVTGGPAAVVISYALWRRAFAADPAMVGQAARLNGVPVVIVGVAEAGFAGVSLDSGADFWAAPPVAPVLLSPQVLSARQERRFRIYVRLADGVSARQATDRLSVVAAQLRAQDPEAWTDARGSTRAVTVAPELDTRFASDPGEVSSIAAGMIGAVAAIVGLACVNLATMSVARGAARTHELSVRLALGASHGRLLRQLGTESLVISIAGAGAAIFVIRAALAVFDAYLPADVPAFSVALDWRVAGFSMLLALGAPVLFGVAPGAHALRLAIAERLKGGSAATRTRWRRAGPRELLLLVQVAASFALLIAASLFLQALMSADVTHASSAAVAVVPIDLNTAARSRAEGLAAADRLLEAAARVPGVDVVTAAGVVPMTGSHRGFVGRLPDEPGSLEMVLEGNVIAPGYLELTGVEVRAGRSFDARDHARAPRVAVVSESLARRLWGTPVPLGRHVLLGDDLTEIVGVAADVPYRSATDASHPVIYLPLGQSPTQRMVVHARVRNHGEVLAALDRAPRTVDAGIIVGPAMPLRQYQDQVLTAPRVTQWVAVAGGVLQLGLALIATWALVSYAVNRRTREMAIRRALGASDASIVRLVMRPSLWLLAIGALAGSAAGLAGAAALHASFIGLAPLDPLVVIPAGSVLGVVVLAAAWFPARRAISAEPAAALDTL